MNWGISTLDCSSTRGKMEIREAFDTLINAPVQNLKGSTRRGSLFCQRRHSARAPGGRAGRKNPEPGERLTPATAPVGNHPARNPGAPGASRGCKDRLWEDSTRHQNSARAIPAADLADAGRDGQEGQNGRRAGAGDENND